MMANAQKETVVFAVPAIIEVGEVGFKKTDTAPRIKKLFQLSGVAVLRFLAGFLLGSVEQQLS
jgi:hypothetical protein